MRRGCLLLVCVGAALATGCFEEPLREEITLVFDSEGSVSGRVLSRLEARGQQSRMDLEIDELRRQIEQGRDPWRSSIRALEPTRDQERLSRELGRLVAIERSFELDDPRRLERLFDADAVRVGVERRGRWLSLELTPIGSRARPAEQQRVRQAQAELARLLGDYLEVTGDLWRWLELHPERERAVLAHVYEDLLDEAETQAVEAEQQPAGERELELLELHDQSGRAMLELLYDEPDGDAPLEFLSRRVLAPLRGALLIEVVGRVERVEGFAPEDPSASRFELPELSYFNALASVAREVVDPLPLVELVRAERSPGDRTPTLAELAAQPRLARPRPPDLAQRIELALRPEPHYLLEWVLPE